MGGYAEHSKPRTSELLQLSRYSNNLDPSAFFEIEANSLGERSKLLIHIPISISFSIKVFSS